MSIAEQTTLRVVLYEGDGAQPLPADTRTQLLTQLLAKGYSVTRTTTGGSVSEADGSHLLVMGDFTDQSSLPETAQEGNLEIRFQSLTDTSTEDALAHVDAIRDELGAADHSAWKPWFPVIDYDRCTNCMQCLSFCLFDVYGSDDEHQIQVQNNDNCKTNCPACSRVCPEAAIMFPKYKSGPINGDTVSSSDLNREKMKIDISALLGGDIYHMLRERSERAQSRFSKERSSDKALTERKKCLVKLQKDASDIPPEVLMSLPSPDEIARKAEEVSAKAEAAMKARDEAEQSE